MYNNGANFLGQQFRFVKITNFSQLQNCFKSVPPLCVNNKLTIRCYLLKILHSSIHYRSISSGLVNSICQSTLFLLVSRIHAQLAFSQIRVLFIIILCTCIIHIYTQIDIFSQDNPGFFLNSHEYFRMRNTVFKSQMKMLLSEQNKIENRGR